MKSAQTFIFIAAMFVSSLSVRAADVPATGPAVTTQVMESWWRDLEETEPKASQALLKFSAHPQEAVEFLRRLRPLKMEADDLTVLLAQLASAKESEWKPAFEQLEYFDPRLAMNLEALMNDVPDEPARTRLVEILCDYRPGMLKGKTIQLRRTGTTDDFNFTDGRSSWWAEARVSRIASNGWGNGKKKWQRAVRAIVLLEHIGTPDAVALIEQMATGHPDVFPTRIAKEVLVSIKSKH